jgi:hypothetical protein
MPSIDERVKRIPEFYSGSIKTEISYLSQRKPCYSCGMLVLS